MKSHNRKRPHNSIWAGRPSPGFGRGSQEAPRYWPQGMVDTHCFSADHWRDRHVGVHGGGQ